jgi:hypothetical protein
LIGVFEIAVKTAFLDWEAAVLPLNYARELIRQNQAFLALFGPTFLSHRCVIVMSAADPARFL